MTGLVSQTFCGTEERTLIFYCFTIRLLGFGFFETVTKVSRNGGACAISSDSSILILLGWFLIVSAGSSKSNPPAKSGLTSYEITYSATILCRGLMGTVIEIISSYFAFTDVGITMGLFCKIGAILLRICLLLND